MLHANYEQSSFEKTLKVQWNSIFCVY